MKLEAYGVYCTDVRTMYKPIIFEKFTRAVLERGDLAALNGDDLNRILEGVKAPYEQRDHEEHLRQSQIRTNSL